MAAASPVTSRLPHGESVTPLSLHNGRNSNNSSSARPYQNATQTPPQSASQQQQQQRSPPYRAMNSHRRQPSYLHPARQFSPSLRSPAQPLQLQHHQQPRHYRRPPSYSDLALTPASTTTTAASGSAGSAPLQHDGATPSPSPLSTPPMAFHSPQLNRYRSSLPVPPPLRTITSTTSATTTTTTTNVVGPRGTQSAPRTFTVPPQQHQQQQSSSPSTRHAEPSARPEPRVSLRRALPPPLNMSTLAALQHHPQGSHSPSSAASGSGDSPQQYSNTGDNSVNLHVAQQQQQQQRYNHPPHNHRHVHHHHHHHHHHQQQQEQQRLYSTVKSVAQLGTIGRHQLAPESREQSSSGGACPSPYRHDDSEGCEGLSTPVDQRIPAILPPSSYTYNAEEGRGGAFALPRRTHTRPECAAVAMTHAYCPLSSAITMPSAGMAETATGVVGVDGLDCGEEGHGCRSQHRGHHHDQGADRSRSSSSTSNLHEVDSAAALRNTSAARTTRQSETDGVGASSGASRCFQLPQPLPHGSTVVSDATGAGDSGGGACCSPRSPLSRHSPLSDALHHEAGRLHRHGPTSSSGDSSVGSREVYGGPPASASAAAAAAVGFVSPSSIAGSVCRTTSPLSEWRSPGTAVRLCRQRTPSLDASMMPSRLDHDNPTAAAAAAAATTTRLARSYVCSPAGHHYHDPTQNGAREGEDRPQQQHQRYRNHRGSHSYTCHACSHCHRRHVVLAQPDFGADTIPFAAHRRCLSSGLDLTPSPGECSTPRGAAVRASATSGPRTGGGGGGEDGRVGLSGALLVTPTAMPHSGLYTNHQPLQQQQQHREGGYPSYASPPAAGGLRARSPVHHSASTPRRDVSTGTAVGAQGISFTPSLAEATATIAADGSAAVHLRYARNSDFLFAVDESDSYESTPVPLTSRRGDAAAPSTPSAAAAAAAMYNTASALTSAACLSPAETASTFYSPQQLRVYAGERLSHCHGHSQSCLWESRGGDAGRAGCNDYSNCHRCDVSCMSSARVTPLFNPHGTTTPPFARTLSASADGWRSPLQWDPQLVREEREMAVAREVAEFALLHHRSSGGGRGNDASVANASIALSQDQHSRAGGEGGVSCRSRSPPCGAYSGVSLPFSANNHHDDGESRACCAGRVDEAHTQHHNNKNGGDSSSSSSSALCASLRVSSMMVAERSEGRQETVDEEAAAAAMREEEEEEAEWIELLLHYRDRENEGARIRRALDDGGSPAAAGGHGTAAGTTIAATTARPEPALETTVDDDDALAWWMHSTVMRGDRRVSHMATQRLRGRGRVGQRLRNTSATAAHHTSLHTVESGVSLSSSSPTPAPRRRQSPPPSALCASMAATLAARTISRRVRQRVRVLREANQLQFSATVAARLPLYTVSRDAALR